jgi:RimJ/RimL family protein N-acetyltransferase
MLYWSSEPHRTIDETERWLAGMVAAAPDESADFVVELDGRVIGKAGIWKLPEIGFILHPDAWGRGLGFEAMRAVIGHAFRRFAVPAITADVDPRNAASLALLDRLGFVVTGRAERTYEIAGRYCDSVYLALPRVDWTARQADR